MGLLSSRLSPLNRFVAGQMRPLSTGPLAPLARIESPKEEEQATQRLHVEPKIEMSMECRPCGLRSLHRLSRQAYTRGVVIVTCPHCHQRHLIADHMGWFPGEPRTVEDMPHVRCRWVKDRDELATNEVS
jgi:protein import protein ZIM17